MSDEHERLREDIAAYALDALDAAERPRVQAHVGVCDACTRLLAEYESVSGLVLMAASNETPPPDVRAAVLSRVHAEPSAPGRDGALPPAGAAVLQLVAQLPPDVEPTTPPARMPLASNRARLLAWGAMAATLVGLLVWNVQLQRRDDDPAAVLRQLANTGSPHPMASTGAAPDAGGQLYLSGDQSRAVLAVSGLPPLPPGKVYQFWYFESAERPRTSGGVFTVDAKGGALVSITVPSGSLARFQQIWVTQEQEGGSTIPTAPHFLEAPFDAG